MSSVDAIQRVAQLFLIHGIGQIAVLRFLQDRPAGHTEPTEDVGFGDWAIVEYDADVAGGEADRGNGKSSSAWADENNKHKACVKGWLATDPAERFVVMLLAVGPQIALLAKLFSAASSSWDDEQLFAALQGSWKYRLCEAHKHAETSVFDCEVRDLLGDSGTWALLGTTARRGTLNIAFRMISRAACGVSMLFNKRHENYPYKLFGALDSLEGAKAVFADPTCRYDTFTRNFLKIYGTVDKVMSADGQAVLRAIGLLARSIGGSHIVGTP
jgi:hypothetical protein